MTSWAFLAKQVAIDRNNSDARNFDHAVRDGARSTFGCVISNGYHCFGVQGINARYDYVPSTFTWIAILGFFIAFVRCLEVRNARSEPVSIEVEEFSYSGLAPGDSGPRGERAPTCTERIRSVLSTQVQTPPPIPGGEPIISLPSILATSSTQDGGAVAKFLAFACQVAFPARGWKLSGRIQEGPSVFSGTRARDAQRSRLPPSWVGISISIREKCGGRSILQKTFWGKDFDDASYSAAYTITKLAINQSVSLPGWAKWRGKQGRGLRYYRDGTDAARKDELDKAKELLTQAVKIDPGNALARSELALTMERSDNYVGALEIYLQLSSEHRELIQPRYRAGVVLDLIATWLPEWKNTSNAAHKLIYAALEEAGILDKGKRPGPSDREVKEFFIKLSGKQLKRLRQDLNPLRGLLIWWWLRKPTRAISYEWIRPFGTLRPRTISAIKAAICAQKLNLLLNLLNGTSPPPYRILRTNAPFKEIEKALRRACKKKFRLRIAVHSSRFGISRPTIVRGGIGALGNAQIAGLASYNAACFYARLVGAQQDHLTWAYDRRIPARFALDYLTKSVRESELREGWLKALKTDPDMALLKEHPSYKAWHLERLDA
ncbi:tetratricopeptide repeat protein [Streptomyces prunicolor]|uniref:tetratricopeptide repeat protein n=1 Tax=Streptomyces prunicolor TaxID=67348 RepID=UPI003413A075